MKTIIQKSVKVVKDYFFTLALVATFIGFSAFKAVNKRPSMTSYWFEVQRISPEGGDTESNLRIVDLADNPPATEPDPLECSTQNEGTVCQANLEIGSTSPSTLFNMTVQQARAATSAPTPDYAHNPDDN